MSKITKDRFLKVDSGLLNHRQISSVITNYIKQLSLLEPKLATCDFFINVVEDKEGTKFGFSYLWVSNIMVYNALLGNNFDSSERFEMVEDMDWEEPERDYFDAMKEAEDSGEWGLMGMVEDQYTRPKIKKKLSPLFKNVIVKYSKEQIQKSNEDHKIIEFEKLHVTYTGKKLNSLYSTCVPMWVTKEMIYNFFEKFIQDKKNYKDKEKKEFKYPIVNINEDKTNKWSKTDSNIIKVSFSNYDKNIAFFLSKLFRKVKISNDEGKKHFFFFTQSSVKT